MKDISSAKSPSQLFRYWTKKYGKTYGIYESWVPTFVTSDVDFIKQVLFDQFSTFPKHTLTPIGNPIRKSEMGLFSAFGAQWRRQRLLNISLMGAVIKEMAPKWIEYIEEEKKSLVDIEQSGIAHDMYQLYKGVFFRFSCEYNHLQKLNETGPICHT